MPSFLKFLAACIGMAWKHSWATVDTLSTLIGLLLPFLLWLKPKWLPVMSESNLGQLAWAVPIGGVVAVVLIRLLLSPYWLYMQRDQQADNDVRKLETKTIELRGSLADELTHVRELIAKWIRDIQDHERNFRREIVRSHVRVLQKLHAASVAELRDVVLNSVRVLRPEQADSLKHEWAAYVDLGNVQFTEPRQMEDVIINGLKQVNQCFD